MNSTSAPDDRPAAASRSVRPWLFAVLGTPLTVVIYGLVGGVLSLLLRSQDVSPARVASIIALLNLPQTIYFLWSPLTDFWIRRRTWLILAACVTAVVMFLAFQRPQLAAPGTVALLFVGACVNQLMVSACGGILGSIPNETDRRRASSFYQGGGLAIGGATVFLFAVLSGHLSVSALGWVVAFLLSVPSLTALLAPEQLVVGGHTFAETFRRIGHEFKRTFWRWKTIPYVLLLVAPGGSGAMLLLLPSLASDYHISSSQVAWINGFGGALLSAAGATLPALFSNRMSAPVVFILMMLLNAMASALLWVLPLQPICYLIGAAAILFAIGAGYAAFTMVVLDFLGDSGKSGATRYSLINSVGNIPVIYMAVVDGKGYEWWGTRGMPGIDALASTIVALLLLAYFLLRARPVAAAPVSPAP